MARQATTKEIRAFFTEQGLTPRIGRDGHVTFTRDGQREVFEGRWVSEYRYDDECGVRLA